MFWFLLSVFIWLTSSCFISRWMISWSAPGHANSTSPQAPYEVRRCAYYDWYLQTDSHMGYNNANWLNPLSKEPNTIYMPFCHHDAWIQPWQTACRPETINTLMKGWHNCNVGELLTGAALVHPDDRWTRTFETSCHDQRVNLPLYTWAVAIRKRGAAHHSLINYWSCLVAFHQDPCLPYLTVPFPTHSIALSVCLFWVHKLTLIH